MEEREVEREVRGAERRKRLSEEREEGSDSYSRPIQVGISCSCPLPHPLTDLPPSIHVNTIIPSVLCISISERCATSHISLTSFTGRSVTSESFLTFHPFLITYVYLYQVPFFTLHPCSYGPYTPPVCLDWNLADDGTHKASQMS